MNHQYLIDFSKKMNILIENWNIISWNIMIMKISMIIRIIFYMIIPWLFKIFSIIYRIQIKIRSSVNKILFWKKKFLNFHLTHSLIIVIHNDKILN